MAKCFYSDAELIIKGDAILTRLTLKWQRRKTNC